MSQINVDKIASVSGTNYNFIKQIKFTKYSTATTVSYSADTPTVITGFEVSICLLYTSPSPRDGLLSRMPSSA